MKSLCNIKKEAGILLKTWIFSIAKKKKKLIKNEAKTSLDLLG